MDQFPPQDPGDMSPSVTKSLVQAIAFAHQIGNSVVSCSVHSGAVKHQLIDLKDLHTAISATASVFVELADFLIREDSSPSVIKPVGMVAVESLVSQTDAVFRKIVILLLKASTRSPETAGFDTGDDAGHPRELTPPRLASVVREDHSDWLRPRAKLCNERLGIICLDLQLHSSIFKLARHQSSQLVGNAGRFDEELAMRAFAERWLTLREKHKKRDLKEQEERFRLRSLKDDDVSECGNGSIDDGRSERGSETSTVVVVETALQTWTKPEKEPKFKQFPVNLPQANTVRPGTAPDITAGKTNPSPTVKGKSSQNEDSKFLASFNRRLKGLFSHEARTLQAVGFRGHASELEAWVIGFQSPTCVVKLPLSSDLVFDDLREEARKSKKSHCDKILDMGPAECQAIEDAKLKGTLTDLRSRTLVHISESRTDLGYSRTSWPMTQRFVVYLAVGEPVETVRLTDIAGEETSIPLDRSQFWPAISCVSKKNRGPPCPHNIRYEMFDAVAEDGAKFFNGQWPSNARPGDKFTLQRRWPQYPVACPPPPRPVSISSRASSINSEPTWEIQVELGFAHEEPVEPTDDETEVKLSDLLRALTHAPDTEFAADVAEGVLGPLRDESDDDDYTLSTVD